MKHFTIQQLNVNNIAKIGHNYGTDLTQRHTRTRVTGYHSPSARTRLGISFNGLELRLKLELKRKPRGSS